MLLPRCKYPAELLSQHKKEAADKEASTLSSWRAAECMPSLTSQGATGRLTPASCRL